MSSNPAIRGPARSTPDPGKGQTVSALMGSLQIIMFFDRGTFWVPICQNPSSSINICQHLSILHTFFLNLSKVITFAATPLVLTQSVCNRGPQARDTTEQESLLSPKVPTESEVPSKTECYMRVYHDDDSYYIVACVCTHARARLK